MRKLKKYSSIDGPDLSSLKNMSETIIWISREANKIASRLLFSGKMNCDLFVAEMVNIFAMISDGLLDYEVRVTDEFSPCGSYSWNAKIGVLFIDRDWIWFEIGGVDLK